MIPRPRRVAAMLGAFAVAVLPIAAAQPAAAIPIIGDCKNTPDPMGIDSGISAILDSGPNHPRPGDPFAEQPTTTLYETYGYGFDWEDYDPGCKPTLGGPALGAINNLGSMGLSSATAFDASLARMTYSPTTMRLFDPVLRTSQATLGQHVFLTLAGCVIAAAASVVGITLASRGDIAGTSTEAAWIVGMLLLGLSAGTASLTFAPKIDQGLTWVIGLANDSIGNVTGSDTDAATGFIAGIFHSVNYETWCAGYVGRPNGAAADEFCPKLWKDSHWSRAEQADLAAHPGKHGDMVKAKKDAFDSDASDLKDKYPDAYTFLAGHHNADRFGYLLLGAFGWAAGSVFLIPALLFVLVAELGVRIAFIILMILPLAGMFSRHRPMVLSVVDRAVGWLIYAAEFGVTSAVFIGSIGWFLQPQRGSNPFVAFFLMAIASAVLLYWLRPDKKVRQEWARGLRRSSGIDDRTRSEKEAAAQAGPLANRGAVYEPAGATQYADLRRAESQPSVIRAAITGAAQQAVSTAAIGALTGGTVTAGAIAAGAAKGAGRATVVETARRSLGATAAQGVNLALEAAEDVHRPELPEHLPERPQLPAGGTVESPAPQPAPHNTEVRIFTPGEASPADHLPYAVQADDGVHRVFTPSEA